MQVNALVDTSGMTAVYSDGFDNPSYWSNPQGNWQIGPSTDSWGTGNIAYIGSNLVTHKNTPQNLITSPASPIDLTGYNTVLLQFNTSVMSTRRGSQQENVILTDSHGVQHIIWAKSKATFSGTQQVDISSYAAGNSSIKLTFQYMKKGGPVQNSKWDVDDVRVLGSVTKTYSTIQFNSSAYTVKEGNGNYAILNLTCTPACPDNSVTVNWSAQDGTAQAGVNYGISGDPNDFDVNGTVTFNAGDTYKIIQVPILDDNVYSSPDLSFNISVQDVTDASGNTISGSPDVAQVTINDADSTQAPVVTMPAAVEINEGSAWSSSGLFVDNGAGHSWTATVDYGDGSGAQPLTLNSDKTFALGHTYAASGLYTVTVTVTNDQELSGSGYTSVTVDNVAPTANAGPDQTVNEGDTVSFSGSATDPGTLDVLTYSWDFGDGSTGVGSTPTHVYADNGVYTVTLTVTDKDGGVGSSTCTITVNNVAPTANAGPDQTVNEGDTVSFSGSATDPGALDVLTYTWDFGDGSPASSGATPTHVYDDNGIYTVTLTVTDKDGGVGTSTCTITVNNVAPTATFNTNSPVNEGSDIVVSLTSPSDPSSADTAAGFTYAFDLGSGYSEFSSSNTASISTTDEGVVTVKGKIMDKDGGVTEYTADVTVNAVLPTLTISGASSVDAGATYTLTLSASESGSDTISSWSINWGDGNVEPVSGNPASVTHVYASGPNDYTISATATDEDGTYDAGNTVDVHVNTATVTYNIPLAQGWNLISIPVSGPSMMESDLINDASLHIVMVAAFDTDSQSYVSYTGDPLDTNLPVTIDRGYFVYCTSPSVLTVSGTVPADHTISIAQGWNMIGWSNDNVVQASDLIDRLSPNCLMVAQFDSASQNFATYTGSSLDVNFDVKPTEGYFVYSASTTGLYVGGNLV